jgi:hypothetical protein
MGTGSFCLFLQATGGKKGACPLFSPFFLLLFSIPFFVWIPASAGMTIAISYELLPSCSLTLAKETTLSPFSRLMILTP